MADDFNVSSDTDGTVCDIYESYPYVIVAVVHSASATLSALCCIFVIIMIFLLKKNGFFIQRLIIYHCLATLVRSLALILLLHRLGYDSDSRVIEVLCTVSGFLNQLSLWYIAVDFAVITFVLLLMGVFNKNVARLEGLYVVLIFIFPLAFNWIPFIDNSYGRFEAVCWIRDINYDNCTRHNFGSILQTALWTVPSFVILVVMIPIYVIVAVYLTKQKYCNRWQKIESMITAANLETNALKKHLIEELWPLVLLTFGAVALNAFPTANMIYSAINPDDPLLALWMLQAIFSPLQGGYIAMVYLLDQDTIKRFKHGNIKAAIKRRNAIREYPIVMGQVSDSATSRDRSLMTPYNEYHINPAGIALRPNQSLSIIQGHQLEVDRVDTAEDTL